MDDQRVAARGIVRARPVAADRLVAELAARAVEARSDFGIRCFWNSPVLADPLEDARLVAGILRKYGGRRGWAAAIGIDKALREAAGASGGVDPVPARGAEPSSLQPDA